MNKFQLNAEITNKDTSLKLTKAHETDAGYDVRARAIMDGSLEIDLKKESFPLLPGERCLILTGIKLPPPEGFEIQVRSRSGLALKNGICVLNSPGTIDSFYSNEIGVILINHSKEKFHIHYGDRIAQLVFSVIPRNYEIKYIENIENAGRGLNGFGSSGI